MSGLWSAGGVTDQMSLSLFSSTSSFLRLWRLLSHARKNTAPMSKAAPATPPTVMPATAELLRPSFPYEAVLLEFAAVAVVHGTMVDDARGEVEVGDCLVEKWKAVARVVEVDRMVELWATAVVVKDAVLAVVVIWAVKVRIVWVGATAAAIPWQME